MKKTVNKIVAAGLVATTVMSLVACGSTSKSVETTKSVEITKPGNFTVMVNNTVVSEANGAQAFYDQLAQATGLDITWIRPDHSSYYDAVSNAFNSEDTMPDVIRLDNDYYSLYAASGLLWDMTDAWNNSETKNSGRLVSAAEGIQSSLMVNGPDGNAALYGFGPARGNGCNTYVKEAWLTKAGYTRADIENKTLSFDQYYAMLKKMREVTGKSVISCAGYVSTEVPYLQYLPEFYQQAHYTFYKNASGQYADGFSEQAMKDAMTRIQTAVKEGVIDQESVNNSTANARDKFYADETGVFTYWAGTWANTLKTNLAKKGVDDSLIAIKPVKELGSYTERIAQTWCITTHAKNPEGIYKYFIDTMLDGGDVQALWTYGAKGVHWDTKAESVTLQGKENSPTEYKEGTFHYLPSVEDPSIMSQKNAIDALFAIGKFKQGDPGQNQIPEVARKNMDFFSENSTVISPVPMTEEFGDNIADINKQRNIIISAVATGAMSAEEGITEYNNKVGKLVETVLKSLNK